MQIRLLPNMHRCLVLQDSHQVKKFQPSKNQIVVHDQNTDQIILRNKHDLLSSLPFEVPCHGLIMSVLYYQLIVDSQFKGLFSNSLEELELYSFELVHLQQIKENYEEFDDFTDEFDETLRQIRMNPKNLNSVAIGGGF